MSDMRLRGDRQRTEHVVDELLALLRQIDDTQ